MPGPAAIRISSELLEDDIPEALAKIDAKCASLTPTLGNTQEWMELEHVRLTLRRSSILIKSLMESLEREELYNLDLQARLESK